MAETNTERVSEIVCSVSLTPSRSFSRDSVFCFCADSLLMELSFALRLASFVYLFLSGYLSVSVFLSCLPVYLSVCLSEGVFFFSFWSCDGLPLPQRFLL